jgi:hypothetical protein
MGEIKGLIAIVIILVSAISTWILGVRMRRRIWQATGRRATSEADLTSLSLWIKVDEIEAHKKLSEPIEPK